MPKYLFLLLTPAQAGVILFVDVHIIMKLYEKETDNYEYSYKQSGKNGKLY